MYGYEWDCKTGGYRLTTQTGKFVANELRPVFAEELQLIRFNKRFKFNPNEKYPLMWAQRNLYFINGEKVAQLNKTQYGKPLSPEFFFEGKIQLKPVDIAAMAQVNSAIMDALVADTLKRIKEMYDKYLKKCDIAYIGFSGGKDSVVLLDLCHRVLPLTVPVIFSDTDMELPDTYVIWNEIQKNYPGRPFFKAHAKTPALENWRLFGPPSRSIRWCCSVHKSSPALILLKRELNKTSIKAMAYLGVRGEESLSRSAYEDIGEGVKTSSQTNLMPILDWGAHELYLYLFTNGLMLNRAYRFGLPRVGCAMCPESSEKYEWFVNALYPNVLQSYCDLIWDTSNKAFTSEADKMAFIGAAGWQARKSGVTLKHTLQKPFEEVSGEQLSWMIPDLSLPVFLEWLKTVGRVAKTNDNASYFLHINGELGGSISFQIDTQGHDNSLVIFHFQNEKNRRSISPRLRIVLHKAIACVGCQACEAECPVGALHTLRDKIAIDSVKCIHCLRCHNGDIGCWRFKSMRMPEGSKSHLSGINRYNNFGLRSDWLPVLVADGKNFVNSPKLGTHMIKAARAWFPQAMLIDGKTRMPTKLISLLENQGTTAPVAWDCIWMGLANNSVLIKWVVSSWKFDVNYSKETLIDMLSPELSDAAKKGGLAALKDMLKKSPFGNGEQALFAVDTKGANEVIVGITRRMRAVDSLVILYGLYVMAQLTGRGSFTIREMIVADFEAPCTSPIAAFGISPETFKAQCLGLSSKYPEFITSSFTHGLDEVRVFPATITVDDVVGLISGE